MTVRLALSHTLFGFYVFSATACTLGLRARNAEAAPIGVHQSAFAGVHTASNGNCLKVSSDVEQQNQIVRVSGFAQLRTSCSQDPLKELPILSPPAGTLHLSYTLWKWNGSTSVRCQSSVGGWVNIAGSEQTVKINQPAAWLDSFGCGDGWYNVGVTAHRWLDGAWQGGTLFSGWLQLDLNDNPPPPPN
jgi:hypothetical protein